MKPASEAYIDSEQGKKSRTVCPGTLGTSIFNSGFSLAHRACFIHQQETTFPGEFP
jgi:hypothetical protein